MSTPYPPTTLESSLGSSSERSLDSSLLSSGPSRKRCRSPTASVPSPTHVSSRYASTLLSLLPPRKRFIDSYSPEDSGEEHTEVDTADAEAVADVGISDEVVDPIEDGVGMGVRIATSVVREGARRSLRCNPDLEDTIYDIVHYMSEVRIDRITKIETTQRQLETKERFSGVDSLRWLHGHLAEEFSSVRMRCDDTGGDLVGLDVSSRNNRKSCTYFGLAVTE
ncbi:hypothetical protein Tco_1274750 [Tanacetum coccineum]